MRAARSAQSQSSSFKIRLRCAKSISTFFSIFARLLVKTGLRDGTSHISRRFMNAAMDLCESACWDSSGTSSGNSRNRIAWTR